MKNVLKRLAGFAILFVVMLLEWAAHVLVFTVRVTRPVRRLIRRCRMRVLMWRTERLCRRIARLQKRLGRMLNRYDRLDAKK